MIENRIPGTMPNNMLTFNILLINVGGNCDTKVKIWLYRLISLVLNWELMVYLSEAVNSIASAGILTASDSKR